MEPGVPWTCSTLGVSAPRRCWTWSRGEHILSYHRFLGSSPSSALENCAVLQLVTYYQSRYFLNFKRRVGIE